MKAILINPENRSVEAIDIRDRDDIVKLIGFDTLESDTVGTEDDRLYFDEACFLRGGAGRFQIDTVIPVSGKAVIAGTAVSAMLKAFATPDVNADEADFLGTEHMIRADHFHNQPCPTDPPGGPPGETSSPPSYTYSSLLRLFGWDYYICHHFDSPW